jgi:hypothetical protein
MKTAFLLIIIFALLTVPYSAQSTNRNNTIAIQSTVYIDILRVGKGKPIYAGDSKERVWLKLVNNTQWSIFIDTFEAGTGEAGSNEEYLYYDVEKIKEWQYSKTEKPLGYKQTDVRGGATELKPGGSINVSVPQNHLAENLKIRIDFRFDWQYVEGRVNPPYSYMRGSVYLSHRDLEEFINKK